MAKVKDLLQVADKNLVGGVDSPVRSFNYVGGEPILIKSGQGAGLYGLDGRKYIDYVLSWGSAILGHAHPRVVKDIRAKIGAGLSFGLTCETEIELSQEIKKAVKSIDKIRFVNSGTEAVMGAVRLARGYTGRLKILKFEHSYHGSADYLLAKSGSGLATLQIPASSGVPKDFIKHTLVAPFGDSKYLEKVFAKFGSQIAAVIVEPVGGNYGVISPDIKFLKRIRAITKKHGAILIFDEVITGFRFHYGTAAGKFGITPDLITFGKIIGGGLPVGAFGGRAKIMDNLAPLGKVYQASTFSGNPVVMQSGLSTLRALRKLKNSYPQLKKLVDHLKSNLIREAGLSGIDLNVASYESMFSLRFKKKADFVAFYRLMLGKGIFLAPSEFEANFISFSHKKSDIIRTIDAARLAFKQMAKKEKD
ncbi:MAG: glutamate-1-semialdehyde 2,1-aminomutase [Candidatus Omnitrophica bacterium]|nr:glutamate-1-semialdehyde 2,1-aminomutase [Candidatus Omnitrophota bacterium]